MDVSVGRKRENYGSSTGASREKQYCGRGPSEGFWIGAAVAACSAAATSLALSWGWTPDYQVATINAVVKKFEEKNANVKVSTSQH
jgi:hypothetical protein